MNAPGRIKMRMRIDTCTNVVISGNTIASDATTGSAIKVLGISTVLIAANYVKGFSIAFDLQNGTGAVTAIALMGPRPRSVSQVERGSIGQRWRVRPAFIAEQQSLGCDRSCDSACEYWSCVCRRRRSESLVSVANATATLRTRNALLVREWRSAVEADAIGYACTLTTFLLLTNTTQQAQSPSIRTASGRRQPSVSQMQRPVPGVARSVLRLEMRCRSSVERHDLNDQQCERMVCRLVPSSTSVPPHAGAGALAVRPTRHTTSPARRARRAPAARAHSEKGGDGMILFWIVFNFIWFIHQLPH